ncbi:MAG: hypothetical protein PVI75_04775 [Gammaproteobacteria bacterium]|jgi:hypothetical protein
MDIVFLFGAGASYGTGGILPESPPLGNKLFFELKRCCPHSWRALPSEVDNIFCELNFETGMGEIYKKYSMYIPMLMRDMAIYFIQFRPIQSKSLYCQLIKKLSKQNFGEVLLSTINYDCLLEYSVLNQGLTFDYHFNDNDRSKKDFYLLKLHGSCNMFAGNINASQGVYYSANCVFEGGIAFSLNPNVVIEHFLVKTGLAPVMCLYMKNKPLSVSPAGINVIQKKWAEYVCNAKAVFIIGVAPNKEDIHIWNPIADSPGNIYYVGDLLAWNNWLKENQSKKAKYLGKTFDKAFKKIVTEVLKYAIK